MKCAYCGNEAPETKEHIISSSILDLFPKCYLTFDERRNAIHAYDPTVKDAASIEEITTMAEELNYIAKQL